MNGFDSKPLYRECISLAALLERLMGKCTRQYRFTIGQRLLDKVMRLPLDFSRAYDEQDDRLRMTRITVMKSHFTEVKVYIDVAFELHLFSQRDFASLLDKLGSVDRQVEGWYRHTNVRVSAIKGDG